MKQAQKNLQVPKPIAQTGIGVDQIPETIRNSHILTGNDMGMLGNVESLPTDLEVGALIEEHPDILAIIDRGEPSAQHKKAQEFLEQKNVNNAWKVLLAKR